MIPKIGLIPKNMIDILIKNKYSNIFLISKTLKF